VRRRLVPHCQTQSLGSDWGLGPCQLISADSIYDDFLTPAALMTYTALAHAAQACSCMVCFSAGYILRDHRKLTLYALNEALIRGPFASAEKKLRIHGRPRPLSAQHWQCAVVALLLPMPPAQDQKTEPKPKPKSRFLTQNRTETDRP